MESRVYTVQFLDAEEFRSAHELTAQARLAATGLHSESDLRIEAQSWHDEKLRRVLIDATSPAGMSVLRILSALLDHEIGPDRYRVDPASTADRTLIDQWKRGELVA